MLRRFQAFLTISLTLLLALAPVAAQSASVQQIIGDRYNEAASEGYSVEPL